MTWQNLDDLKIDGNAVHPDASVICAWLNDEYYSRATPLAVALVRTKNLRSNVDVVYRYTAMWSSIGYTSKMVWVHSGTCFDMNRFSCRFDEHPIGVSVAFTNSLEKDH